MGVGYFKKKIITTKDFSKIKTFQSSPKQYNNYIIELYHSDNYDLKIYKGLTIFKTNAGSVTDDSYMAMSLSFAIMDNNKLKELNQNLIFFLLWRLGYD